MKIAIIGAGNVGGTLGKRFAEAENEVYFGVRNPSEFNEKDLGGKIGNNAEACKDAEIIVLSVPYNAVSDAIKSCGDISGNIVVDATNPLGMTSNGLNLTIGFDTSGAEKLQTLFPNAKVVKCFNQTGFGNMAKPRGSIMFACGNDKEATYKVAELASSIGFEAMNIGDLSKARLLEPLAMLWIHLSFTSELKRDFAFAIQK
jgi:8-hydroxy-5-deazaflavin:NADPH oxidoreductase